MICFGCSVMIYILHCATTMMKIYPLFLIKLYDLEILIMWYKCGQIGYNITELIVRNGLFFLVTCGSIGLCSASYILIRLNHQLPPIVVTMYFIGYLCIALMAKIGWGMITMVDRETKQDLNLLELRLTRKIRTMKEYVKIVKSLRPVAAPIGFGNYTFFRAKKTNELMFGSLVVNNTISLLLI